MVYCIELTLENQDIFFYNSMILWSRESRALSCLLCLSFDFSFSFFFFFLHVKKNHIVVAPRDCVSSASVNMFLLLLG